VKHLAVVVFLAIFTFAQANQNPAPSQAGGPAAAANSTPQSRHVMILVTATEHSGSPAAQLAEKDISVTDNNEPGEVLQVRPASQLPLRLGIILLAGKPTFGQQQAAAIDLTHKVLRPNLDRAFVITARGDRLWANPRIDWQSGAGAMEKAIRALDKDAGLPDPFAFDMKTEDAGMDRHFTLFQYGGQGLGVFNILWQMLKSDPSPARRAVVMFRDPWAHSPGFGGTQYTDLVEDNHTRLISDAQQLWTSFYIVGLEAPRELPKEFTDVYAPIHTGEGGYNRVYDQNIERARGRALDGGKVNLQRIATETGGGLWWSSKKNYSDAVDGIARQLNSQFAVTYAVHSEPSSGPTHLLTVKSVNSGTRIISQGAYFSRQVQTPPSQAPSPELQARPSDANQK
jgi:hypothetical protein